MSVTPPNKQIAKPSQGPARHWINIGIILLICAAVIVAVIVGTKKQSGGSHTPYSYSKLVDSKVQGSSTSIEFLRPQEFTLSAKDSTVLESLYTHNGTDGQGNQTVLGAEAGYAPHYIIDENPTIDLSAVRNSFNNASDYQNYAKQAYITSFLSDEMNASYFAGANGSNTSINLSQPKSITTSNLATDTWQFPFTATNSGKPNVKVQGEVVFHLGKDTSVYNGYDYLMISTVDYSWQSNQSIWQQIVNSLKITDK